jgi:hypothetical protein
VHYHILRLKYIIDHELDNYRIPWLEQNLSHLNSSTDPSMTPAQHASHVLWNTKLLGLCTDGTKIKPYITQKIDTLTTVLRERAENAIINQQIEQIITDNKKTRLRMVITDKKSLEIENEINTRIHKSKAAIYKIMLYSIHKELLKLYKSYSENIFETLDLIIKLIINVGYILNFINQSAKLEIKKMTELLTTKTFLRYYYFESKQVKDEQEYYEKLLINASLYFGKIRRSLILELENYDEILVKGKTKIINNFKGMAVSRNTLINHRDVIENLSQKNLNQLQIIQASAKEFPTDDSSIYASLGFLSELNNEYPFNQTIEETILVTIHKLIIHKQQQPVEP